MDVVVYFEKFFVGEERPVIEKNSVMHNGKKLFTEKKMLVLRYLFGHIVHGPALVGIGLFILLAAATYVLALARGESWQFEAALIGAVLGFCLKKQLMMRRNLENLLLAIYSDDSYAIMRGLRVRARSFQDAIDSESKILVLVNIQKTDTEFASKEATGRLRNIRKVVRITKRLFWESHTAARMLGVNTFATFKEHRDWSHTRPTS